MHKSVYTIKQLIYTWLILVFLTTCVTKSKLESCNIVPMTLAGQPSLLETPVQQENIIDGSANAVFVKDNYTYLGIGEWFVILDTSDVTDPQLVNYINLQVGSILVVGEYMHVGGKEPHIFNISDPMNLEEFQCQETDPIKLANAVIVGDYAYVPDWEKGLRIFDISDPKALLEISVFQEHTSPEFRLLPRPELIGSQPMLIIDVVISDKYAYISESLLGIDSLYDGQVRILDISNPAKPKPVGIYEMPNRVGAEQVEISNNYLFVSASLFDEPSSILLDISEPTDPVEIDIPSLPGGVIAFWRNYVYFATGLSSLQMWDITDQREPVQYNWDDFHYGFALDAFFFENHAYLATQYGGLRIVDITDPVNPITVSTYP